MSNEQNQSDAKAHPVDTLVMCHDCGCDATKDRCDNGDNKIRCGACATAKYKRDCPLWFLPMRRSPVIVITA
jgi:hypothetical protein